MSILNTMVWFLEGVCFLPTFLVIWSSSTFITNYIIAVFRRDIDVLFPYISDTGASPPESCIFGLMATISAFAGFVTMFARYKYVQKLQKSEATTKTITALNKASLVFATTSCVGMLTVATFQETLLTIVHDIGAFVFFLSGVIYIILQTYMSYLSKDRTPKYYLRIAFALLAFIAAIPTIICGLLVKTTKLHWNPDDKYYMLHRVSAVSEWTVAFTFVCFFFTYIQEFQHFTLKLHVEIPEFT